MNQDQVKQKLLQLHQPAEEFRVVFSGKKSRKVDGLYKAAEREILLHNKNFSNDNELLYTAIHELAHHLQFTESAVPVSSRTHTTSFWSTFHSLLKRAEEIGLYESLFDKLPEFRVLTRRIKTEFIAAGGGLMKELGSLLKEARALCQKHGARFDDYLDRVLSLPRSSAKTIMRSHELDLQPAIGFENMRSISRITDEAARDRAQAALLSGESPETVKMRYISPPRETNPLQALESEKRRIRRTIDSLNARLQDLNRRIRAYRNEYQATGAAEEE
jgi:hypothetical protein